MSFFLKIPVLKFPIKHKLYVSQDSVKNYSGVVKSTAFFCGKLIQDTMQHNFHQKPASFSKIWQNISAYFLLGHIIGY